MNQCIICQTPYEPYSKNQVVCPSPSCKAEQKRRWSAISYRAKKQPLSPKKCLECGKTFTPKHGKQVACSNVCQDIKNKRNIRQNQIVKQTKTDNRPYTSTTAMTIVSNLMRGESIKCMADLLDRDIKELKAYIKVIEQDGTAERIRQRLKYAENYNPYRNF